MTWRLPSAASMRAAAYPSPDVAPVTRAIDCVMVLSCEAEWEGEGSFRVDSELSHAAVDGELVSVRERRVERQENGCPRGLFGTTKAFHRSHRHQLLVDLL